MSDKQATGRFFNAAKDTVTDSNEIYEIFKADQKAEDAVRINLAKWAIHPLFRFGV